jgi:hypothetical protein
MALLLDSEMVWVPVKVLLVASCGTLVVSRFRVTVPLVPPPVKSVPAVTPVIVPVASVTQLHALPLYSSTWLAEQAFKPMV